MMKRFEFILMLIVILAGCAPAVYEPALTETPFPAIISTTVVPASTEISVTITPSPIPTEPPIPLITPDPIQVERWREYQTELARTIHRYSPPESLLCEWVILGQSDQKLYVWAVCETVDLRFGSVPIVIYLNADGSILDLEKPKNWTVENIHEMFPEDVRNKFDYMYAGEIQKMSDHIKWRWAHPGEPPLIILAAIPTATPVP